MSRLSWEKTEESYGTHFEGDLDEKVDYGVATSNSTMQLLFHYPLIFFQKSASVDQCRFFGNHECFLKIELLRELLEILSADPLIFFFFEVKGQKWSLNIEDVYEGEILSIIEKVCADFHHSFAN